MLLINWLKLEVRRRIIKSLLTPSHRKKIRGKRERKRKTENRSHQVFYLHQVDDPHSHLCCQILDQLENSYDIEVMSLVVGPPPASSTPEVEMLQKHNIEDAKMIAPYYGLTFDTNEADIEPQNIKIAQSILLGTNQESFAKVSLQVGDALWRNDSETLQDLQQNSTVLSDEEISARIQINSQKQKKLGHYYGGVFAYEGECYGCIDRVPFLEERLVELGTNKSDQQSIFKRKSLKDELPLKLDGLTLEVLFSVRSPYSYLALQQLIEFRKRYPIKVVYRPILPMVMRGMVINREKMFYILSDCKRIAEKKGIPFGNIVDPLGKAVERCYSLFKFIKKKDKEEDYFNTFLRAVWSKGQHGYLDKTIRNVVEKIGLSWEDAKKELDNDDWLEEIEANRLMLYEVGKWGPPTLILKNRDNKVIKSLWGQDRIWLVEEELYLMQERNK